jgi:cytochrome P450
MSRTCESFDLDLFSDEILTDPYPTFRALRDSGPVVYLEREGWYAFPRYESADRVINDVEHFSSAQGVSLNENVNQYRRGTLNSSDPPRHEQLRAVLSDRLGARAIAELRLAIEAQASELVASVVAAGSFDAVTELAQVFPLTVVADLVGLPDHDREHLVHWANAAFDCFGPENDRARASFPVLEEMYEYIVTTAKRENLRPGSMGLAIYEAADRGEIEASSCIPLMSAYIGAGIDTTVNAIANAIERFADAPEQWAAVRADRTLIRSAFNESLRYDAPVQFVSRVATVDVEVDGTVIPEGSRIVVLIGSANRDERKFPDPDRFDITRASAEHLSFGWGIHICAGQALARLEAHSLFGALADHVERFTAGTPVRRLNNVLRGLASLPVVATLA